MEELLYMDIGKIMIDHYNNSILDYTKLINSNNIARPNFQNSYFIQSKLPVPLAVYTSPGRA